MSLSVRVLQEHKDDILCRPSNYGITKSFKLVRAVVRKVHVQGIEGPMGLHKVHWLQSLILIGAYEKPPLYLCKEWAPSLLESSKHREKYGMDFEPGRASSTPRATACLQPQPQPQSHSQYLGPTCHLSTC